MAMEFKEPFKAYEGKWVTNKSKKLVHLIRFLKYDSMADIVTFRGEGYINSVWKVDDFISKAISPSLTLLDNEGVIRTIWQILE